MNFSKKNGNSEISNPSLLGAHVRTHSPSGDYWIMSALALIFGSVSTVLALFSLSAKSDGSVAGKVIFLIVGLAALIYWWRGARTSVEVYEDGIIYRRAKSIRAFRWTDINEVYQRSVKWRINFIPFGTVHVFTIVTNSDRIILNGNIEDVSKLGQQIQEKTFSVKMPEIIKTHNDGAILRFGQLALQRGKGIWHRKAFIPWQDVKGVDLSEGYIKIQKHGKWLPWRKIAAASVPNLLVFLAVVQQPQAFTVR